MKTLIILIGIAAVGALFIWYVSTRDTSSLMSDKDGVHVALNKKSILIKAGPVKEESLKFPTLNVQQSILRQKDGNLLVFEEAETDDMYQYNFSASKTVQMVFDADGASVLFQANNLYFFTVSMKDRKSINVIFRQSDDQKLTMIYGFNDAEFMNIIKTLGGPEARSHGGESAYSGFVADDQNSVVKTKWGITLNDVDSLIVPSDIH
ncbi:MAG: hypothetical protein B5M52_07115 [Helicobacteraceae bacterium 4484_230]|nr:MAG: hypothetical protein B5M52_07115 [Helicobacteraceae bacterium 4484_230]